MKLSNVDHFLLARVAAPTATGAACLAIGYKAVPAIAATVSTIALPYLLATGALLSTAAYLTSNKTLPLRMISHVLSAASGAALATALLVHATAIPWFAILTGAAAISLWTSLFTEKEQSLRTTIDICLYENSSGKSDKSLLLLGKRALQSTSPSTQESGLKLLLSLVQTSPEAIENYAQELLGQEKNTEAALELLKALIDIGHLEEASIHNIVTIAQNKEAQPTLRLQLYTFLVSNKIGHDADALALAEAVDLAQGEQTVEAHASLLAALVTTREQSTLNAACTAAASANYSVDSRYKLCELLVDTDMVEDIGRIAQNTNTPLELRLRLYALFVNQNISLREYLSLARDLANSIDIPDTTKVADAHASLLIALIEKSQNISPSIYKMTTENIYSIDSLYNLCASPFSPTDTYTLTRIVQNKNTPLELRLRLFPLLLRGVRYDTDTSAALALAKSANSQDAKIAEAQASLLKALVNNSHEDAYPFAYETAAKDICSADSRYELCELLLYADQETYAAKIAIIARNEETPPALRFQLYTLLVLRREEYDREALTLASRINPRDAKIAEARVELLLNRLAVNPGLEYDHDVEYKAVASGFPSISTSVELSRMLFKAGKSDGVLRIAQSEKTPIELQLQLYFLLVEQGDQYYDDILRAIQQFSLDNTRYVLMYTDLLRKLINKKHDASITYAESDGAFFKQRLDEPIFKKARSDIENALRSCK